jgi:uncharacterized membrane protein
MENNRKIRLITFTAMFAVLCYVTFAYAKIDIPTAGGKSTAIHLANAVVVLAGWFLGPVYGGLAGGIGLSLADLMDPRYITSAPKTFLMKFLIGFIAGWLAHKLKPAEKTDNKAVIGTAALCALAALGFNVIFDPIIGYLYKRFLLGLSPELTAILQSWAAFSTAINAAMCLVVSVLLYLALHKSFVRIFPR